MHSDTLYTEFLAAERVRIIHIETGDEIVLPPTAKWFEFDMGSAKRILRVWAHGPRDEVRQIKVEPNASRLEVLPPGLHGAYPALEETQKMPPISVTKHRDLEQG